MLNHPKKARGKRLKSMMKNKMKKGIREDGQPSQYSYDFEVSSEY
jgi:hypothetical protein